MESKQNEWLAPSGLENTVPAPEPQGSIVDESQKPLLKRIAGSIAVFGVLLLKWGAKVKVLLLLLPKVKLLTTAGTMVVSVAAYTLLWSWKFALGFVILLFAHEMGHYIQLRREGVKPSGMFFIPFLGAAIFSRSLGGSALAEARVGLAGPVLGSLASAALVPIALLTDSEMLKALAFTGFFLNLFNLVPIVPLDGGRAMAAMAPWMWFVGFAVMIALVIFRPNPILILIVLLGGMETWRRWRERRNGEEGNARYYEVKPAHRWIVAAVYIGLIVLLAIGMDLTHIQRSLSDV